MEDYKELLPWVLGVLGTIIGWKKDLIKSKFSKQEEEIGLQGSVEDVQSKQLANVEHEIVIYRGIVTDLKNEMQELRDFIQVQKNFIAEQSGIIKEHKTFIAKQSRSLDYYEKKCDNRGVCNPEGK